MSKAKIYSDVPLAQTVIDLCKVHGIRHVVISPGSRNAPLTIGFSHDPFFQCYSVVDERSAGFFAMGIAQRLGEPVAVLCTSGSAVLNYYPAVSEAYYSHLPLVVLSADRPEHLIGIGDGQTINQEDVFSNHILYSANLSLIPKLSSVEWDEKLSNLVREIKRANVEKAAKALAIAKNKPGPVHINIPFDEPLYGTTSQPVETYTDQVNINGEDKNGAPKVDLTEFMEMWEKSKRKMVICGVLYPDSLSGETIEKLAADKSVVVFTETTSNFDHPRFFPGIDKIIMPLDETGMKDLQPDLLVTFGGMVISKKIKAVLRNFPPKYHWHIGMQKANDTFFCLSHHIQMSPEAFLSELLSSTGINTESGYRPHWQAAKSRRAEAHEKWLEKIDYSDFTVFEAILKLLPQGYSIHVSNSSTIRYMQLFERPEGVEFFCNRGTSGIDGSVSTAVGFASANERPTLLVTGDLSFFYDSNGLWNKYVPDNFKIILINNGGGGIFRILPGDKNTENFDRFFETIHDLDASHLCKMYGLEYAMTDNEKELVPTLKSFFDRNAGPALLEIKTPRKYNDEVLLDYFKFLGMERWDQQ
ncbi:MAG: 2-succinyl-5-enolpyruvyl-6-hydroxy-3-cyclohexene-1-carboxylic-acid synthase [Saprospirales bacterium]|nr:MAG: 2-succinyl-5-enolpyruvyl-6-hydroxy-3-cyclohexene-1-carboxylic-acid synthase [Saprospirales bacterium]